MFSQETTVEMQILLLILYIIYLLLILSSEKNDNKKLFFKIIMYRFRNDIYFPYIFFQEAVEMAIVLRESQF